VRAGYAGSVARLVLIRGLTGSLHPPMRRFDVGALERAVKLVPGVAGYFTGSKPNFLNISRLSAPRTNTANLTPSELAVFVAATG
jgi:hypothetical protein